MKTGSLIQLCGRERRLRSEDMAKKVEAGLLRAAKALRTGPAQRGAGVMGTSDGLSMNVT